MSALAPTVAILHLGSAGSLGGRRRVAGLEEIFRAAGAEVLDVALLADHPLGPRDLVRSVGDLGRLAGGRVVPESLAWSHRAVIERLEQVGVDVVVCVSARAFHPLLLAGPWTVVVDFVDRLSDSYADRARIAGRGLRSLAFRVLATTARRFERRPLPAGTIGIAAGWDDARALGVDWVPITMTLPAATGPRSATHDVLFLGKLSYPPNVAGIVRLGAVWPAVLARRPGTTLLLAGAAPSAAVASLAERRGWTLRADFPDLAQVVTSARIAAAPLRHASGIQIKVLEAASFGLPQVIGTAVAKGFGPGMPALVVDTDDQLVTALVGILDDPVELARLGAAAKEHIGDVYSVARWVPWARGILDGTQARPL